MKKKVISILSITLFTVTLMACSEEQIEPSNNKKDMAKGATKEEAKW
jgi:hypothetical protein